jgi:hypothetical protein
VGEEVIFKEGAATILYGNIQCLRNKTGMIEAEIVNNLPDFICLTEHWLTEAEVDSTTIDGYNIASYFCRVSHKNGGVVIFSRKGIEVKEVKKHRAWISEIDFEVAVIEYKGIKGSFMLMCVYRSPRGNYDAFLDGMAQVLQQLCLSKSQLIICGDFNVDFSVEGANKKALTYILASYGLQQNIHEPTRIAKTSATCIDNVFSGHRYALAVRTRDLGLSDHRCIEIAIPGAINRDSSQQVVIRRTYSNKQLMRFKNNLREIDWEPLYKLDNVDQAFNWFADAFKRSFNNAFPLRTKLGVGRKSKRSEWFTPELKILSINLREAYTDMRDLGGAQRNIKYKILKREYKNTINAAKRECNDNKLSAAANKAKAAWDIVRENTNKNAGESMPDIALKVNNVTVNKKEEVARIFSDYFGNAVKSLLCTRPAKATASRAKSTRQNKALFLTPIMRQEFHRIISQVCKKRSAGADEIPGFVLKHVNEEIAEPLMDVINKSFSQGIFPVVLKETKIIPCFKKGEKKSVDNYRPIALLSVFSKVFEKAFCTRLNSFLSDSSAINREQHGFIKGKSTSTAIANYVSEVLRALDEPNREVIGVFYDFSKAFDTISHEVLLSKLNDLGVVGVANSWIRSYLTDRIQAVHIRNRENGVNIKSPNWSVDFGLPQGSTISPLLFTVYTCDIGREVSTGILTQYADDTTQLISANNNDVGKIANVAVQQMLTYCEKNDLFVNKSKTVFMNHRANNKKESFLIKIHGQSIKECNTLKFLGIHMDSMLKYTKHIDYLCTKIASASFLIKKLVHLVSFKIVRSVYYAHIQAQLQYGIIIWGGSTHLKRLFTLQKRVLRNMAKASLDPCADVYIKDSCRPIFVNFKVMTLPCLYIYHCIKFVIGNIDLNDDVPARNLRNKKNYRNVKLKTVRRSRDPNYAGKKYYNALPSEIKEIKGPKFDTALKTYLIRNCFYSTDEFLQ